MIQWRNDGTMSRADSFHTTSEPDHHDSETPRILVCVPPTGAVHHLLNLGIAIAQGVAGQLLLATVVSLPRITPYSAADSVISLRSRRLAGLIRAIPSSVESSQVVVIAHTVSNAIVDLAARRDIQLILVGWPESHRRSWFGLVPGDPVREILAKAVTSVCVLERLPSTTPESVLVAVSSEDLDLGMSVGQAMISCSMQTLFGSGRRESRSLHGRRRRPTSSVSHPGAVPGFALDQITVAGPMLGVDVRSVGRRATAVGADVLVASAREKRGLWPLNQRVPRTELADTFPGPIALVQASRPLDEGHRPKGGKS